MKLYDITQSYRELFDAFDTADDLTDEEIEAYFDTLEAIEGDFEIKAENIACFIKELTAESQMYDSEIKSLQARKKAKDNVILWRKTMLVDGMTQLDKKKIDRPRAKLTLRQNPESADVGDEKEFIAWAQMHDHDDLLKYGKPTVAKTAVKQAIEDGTKLPPYVKIVRTTSVIIK